ncbi:MAG: PAS domain S-box protein [Candidatus Eremiobacteraeota bacterium]|nr:PAS domain S-box protein [Candidatus Eremiobacteraeota bacterium]
MPVAALAADGSLVEHNRAWQIPLSENTNLDTVCQRCYAGRADEVALAVRRVLGKQAAEAELEFPGAFRLSVTPIETGGVLIMHLESREQAHGRMLRIAGHVARLGGWELDLLANTVVWSEEMFLLLEIPTGSPLSVDEAMKYYLPEYHEIIEKQMEACLAGGVLDFEAEMVTTQGRRLWVRCMGEAVKDPSGRVVKLQGALQDVTDRKQLEQSLVASEWRFQRLAESLPMVVWSARPNGVVDFSNHHFFDYTGLKRENYWDTGWQVCLHPEDRDQVVQLWSECVRELRPFDLEYRVRRGSDGAYRWFRVQAAPARDSDGKVIKWFGTALDVHQSKQLEQEAVRVAERLTNTLESLTDAVLMLDCDWCVTFMNSQAEKLVHRSRDELLGKSLWEEFPEARGTRYEELYRKSVAEQIPVTFEEYYPPLNLWTEVRAYPSSEGLAIYFRDVSERMAAREALRTSEERFRFLTKATNDAIWDWGLDNDSLWWSEGFETLFGFQRSQVEPDIASWYNRIHPADRDHVKNDIHKALDGDSEVWICEYRFSRKDGSYATVLDRGYIIRDESGKAVRMIGGMTDLTQHKLAEARIREQAALIDQSRDAILVLDLEHQVTFWSKGAERVYGWTAEEAQGRVLDELLDSDVQVFGLADQQVREKGEWSGEIQHRSRTGTRLTLDARWTLLRGSAGEARAILSIDTDITQAKLLEQQFLRAQRMESIGTLAGGIAHDLNNVLAPILLSLEYLHTILEEPDVIEVLQTMEASAQRGADMVRQVLAFARGVEGRRMEVQVGTILKETEQFTRDTFPKQIAIELQLPEQLPSVMGDPTQLHQVLVNLCVNARDSMPQGGKLRISADRIVLPEQGIHLRLQVLDTGTGIPPEILEKIYDPFFTTKDIGKGTGLGLSTTLAIVKSHGGFLQVSSEMGRGTCFEIYLPASQQGGEESQASPGEEALPRGHGQLVLVVDDEAGLRQAAARMLETHGYRVVQAGDGAEALHVYSEHHQDVAAVVTDLMMPVMDGLVSIGILRRLKPGLPVVAASGLGSAEQEEQLVRLGVRHFLTKPYAARALLTALQELLEAP